MTVCAGEHSGVQSLRVVQQPEAARYSSGDLEAQLILRRELWSAVVRALNHSKLPYCLLGAVDDMPELADSDMDFVVRPCDFSFVPQLLASAAASAGAQLVQAIQHETTAAYFVLAKQQRDVVAFVHPDCTTDYRRQRTLWMSSDELLRGRRRASGGYFRPAPDVEFKYYLIKQVLKRTLTDTQWAKLVKLYEASPCPLEGLSLWTREIALRIEQSLRTNDRNSFRQQLPHYHDELAGRPFQEGILARSSSSLLDGVRVLGRMARPTGLFVQLSGASPGLRTELAWRLAKTLAPAFRHASVVTPGNPAKVLRTLLQSTLLVSTEAMIPLRRLYGGVDVRWQPTLTRRENFAHAAATILSHLSQRTMCRLELQSRPLQRLELETLVNSTSC